MSALRHSHLRLVAITAVTTLLAAVVLLVVLARFIQLDVGVGGVVLRTQRGTEIPFRTETSNRRPDPRFAPTTADHGPVRNLILVIGDGMGIGQAGAASMILHGPEGGLTMEGADAVGLLSTTAGNSLVADSAASASALATGFAVDRKALSWLPDDRTPRTLLEAARLRGLATGVVTTSGLADATPAAFLAHAPRRSLYPRILEQVLASGADVLVGGDWSRHHRAGRDAAYLAKARTAETLVPANVTLVRDVAALRATEGPVVALFPPRPDDPDLYGPPLATTAREALRRLLTDPDGFVLILEQEGTDEAGHDNDVRRVVRAAAELDDAVRTVLQLTADRSDTLVLVTADHDTGGLAIVSAPYARGTARVRWVSHDHTAQWVPLFAWGPGAEAFDGVLHTTEIARRLGTLLELPDFPDPSPRRP